MRVRDHTDSRNSGQYQVIRKGVECRVYAPCAMRHLPSAESPELRANSREQEAAGRGQSKVESKRVESPEPEIQALSSRL